MRRLVSLAGLVAVLALGAGTAVAAGSASIHLKAPSSISATKQFQVTASGTAPSNGKHFVFVLFTKKASCAKSIGAGQNRGDFVLPFGKNNGAQIGHGPYSVKTSKVDGGKPGSGILCGYLYSGTQKVDSAPEAHASHAIKFT